MNAPSAIERYSVAASVGISDRDAILAAAMAGGWATNLFRLKYSNDAKEYQGVLVTFKQMANQVSRRSKWKAEDSRIRELAKKVLDYWLADTCPSCLGRGYEVMEGTPMLSERECKECHGRGVRAWESNGEWSQRGFVLLGYIQAAEKDAGAKMMQLLRRDMDF